MRSTKILQLLSVFMLFVNTSLFAQKNEFLVLVASYNQSVNNDHFQNLELGEIHENFEHGTMFKYYVGPYTEENEALVALDQAKNQGFMHARMIDVNMMKELCAQRCNPYVSPIQENDNLRNIFFDYDSYSLKHESRKELSKLTSLLQQNPNYSVELHGHTDAKGSNEYNIALSNKRKNAAFAYLVANGVASSRINGFFHGEKRPVANNQMLNGQDTPIGRQLNRRVELKVKYGNRDMGLVQAINVPSHLQN